MRSINPFAGARLGASLALPLVLSGAPGHGQQAVGNVQRAAQDAFGTSIGRDSIGLYSTGSVRGFSPAAAGNVRIEGLYTDTVADLTDLAGTLVAGSTVKVGPSVLGYPFPAPTGIADFRLRLPSSPAAIATEFGVDGVGGAYAELNGSLDPAPGKLALTAGLGVSRDAVTYAQPARHLALSATARWRPTARVEIIPFAGYYWHDNDPAQPRYIISSERLPPRIKRHRRLTQPWAVNDAGEGVVGVIGRLRGEHGVWIDGGLFGQRRVSRINYSDHLSGVTGLEAPALHKMVATPPQRSNSISGELRLTKHISEGPRVHRLITAVRGRSQRRRYGGSASVTLGLTSIDDPALVDKPVFTFLPQSNDGVRQLGAGIGYHGQWDDVGELSVNAQRIWYRKTRSDPLGANVRVAEDVWAYSASLAAHVTDDLALFVGTSRGFEEAAQAPDSAVNRDEAPGAALTSQQDFGLRWKIGRELRLIAGAFSIRKPYFNLDSDRFYRRLGTVSHKGFELSVTGEPIPNLNLLAGLVALHARVSSETNGSTQPVGTPPLIGLVSGDYQLRRPRGLSMEATVSHHGRKAANTLNSLFVPASTNVTAGVRYKWTAQGVPLSARLQVTNLLNRYSWDIRASNSFFYSTPRLASFRFTAGF